MSSNRAHVAANTERFSGFAELYDIHRPKPPEVIVDLLTQVAAKQHPVVVDLGSGTGLSTLLWTRVAAEVVGVEPNADMRFRPSAAPPNPARAPSDLSKGSRLRPDSPIDTPIS